MNIALRQAAMEGHAECVRFILACGFPVESKETGGQTALHAAVQSGKLAVIKLLLNSGADIEARGDDNYTPLMHAMFADKAQAVGLLVSRNASITDGLSALMGAKHGSIAALQALMTSRRWLAMNPHERRQAEKMLLHTVADKATLDALRSLVLDMPALIHFLDPNGDNALHRAAYDGKTVILVCALIKEGVDPTHRNKAGQTPAEVASEAGHTLQATLRHRAAEDQRRRDQQQQQQQQQTTG